MTPSAPLKHEHTKRISGIITRQLRSLVALSLEEDGIEEDGRSHNQSLLLGRGILRKVAFEYVCVGEDLSSHALLDLEDLA